MIAGDLHPRPTLVRVQRGGIAWHTDPALAHEGVVLAFTESIGGTSVGPFASLNLGSHVGDDPKAVDLNRMLLLEALNLSGCRENLTMAQQVHADRIAVVDDALRGSGAYAASGTPPIPETDSLVTGLSDVPLLLCFADCVPVALVAPGPVVAVAHAGWRGALLGVPGSTAVALAASADCEVGDIRAYIGPHIRSCHYDVSDEILSNFAQRFGTVAQADSGGLDLSRVVTASLTESGVDQCNIAGLGICTAETTDLFFSYRAQGGLTGRHGALVCISSR